MSFIQGELYFTLDNCLHLKLAKETMKECSITFLISEMQIKTIVWNNFIPNIVAKNKILAKSSVRENLKQAKFLLNLVGIQIGATNLEKNLA